MHHNFSLNKCVFPLWRKADYLYKTLDHSRISFVPKRKIWVRENWWMPQILLNHSYVPHKDKSVHTNGYHSMHTWKYHTKEVRESFWPSEHMLNRGVCALVAFKLFLLKKEHTLWVYCMCVRPLKRFYIGKKNTPMILVRQRLNTVILNFPLRKNFIPLPTHKYTNTHKS